MNPKQIDTAFDAACAKIEKYHYSNSRTGIENALGMMLVAPKDKAWWLAHEFIGKYKHFYGTYKASARISDLAIHFPEIVESRRYKRFTLYRLRRENFAQVMKIENPSYAMLQELIMTYGR